MYIDKLNEFSDAQLITGAFAGQDTSKVIDSTNTLDLGDTENKLNVGEPFYLQVRVNTLCTSGGSATLQVALMESVDGNTFTVAAQTGEIAVADLTAGKLVFSVGLPQVLKRFIKLSYTVGTAAMTAGKLDAFLVPAVQLA